MASLRFGTDGVRGVANSELTPEWVLALGRAAAQVLGRSEGAGPDHGRRRGDHDREGPEGGRTGQPAFVVGRDTRRSGPLLQAALSAGLASEGVDVIDLGVLPTPGVAHVAALRDLPAAVVSASHNPFADNGIKLFARGGRKLGDQVERAIEAELGRITGAGGGDARTGASPGAGPTGAAVGRIEPDPAALDQYVAHLVGSLEGRTLDGLQVVVDCANGAASTVAPVALRELGASVTVVGDVPDGTNINDGVGSTAPQALQAAVVRSGADVGLAFDGDADRVLAVDHRGEVVDGDHVIALAALDRRERGLLRGDTVVVTVMTNLGFRLAMADKGVKVAETAVGDRYVLEAMTDNGWTLGGEQSGHIIFGDLATTGDGTLTGLQLLDLLKRRGRPLAELASEAMTRLPQVLRNVRVARLDGLAGSEEVWAEVARVEAGLGATGRVLLRASGTEPLVRVMVEAPTGHQAEEAVAHLCRVVEQSLGAAPR